MRPHGRARVSSKSPQAFGICDRCGFLYNHVELRWQFDWAGASMINKRMLVCATCEDTPQEQLRAIVLPADPTPILNARVEDYAAAASDQRIANVVTTTDSVTGLPTYTYDTRVTSEDSQDGGVRVSQETGAPSGSDNSQPGSDINAIMPLLNKTKYGTTLPVISITTDGVSVVTVTCSSAHNLASGDLIAVQGGGSNLMDGFYNVTVASGTKFTYQPTTSVPIPGLYDPSLLQYNTLFKTAYIGVPYNTTQIPQSGVIS